MLLQISLKYVGSKWDFDFPYIVAEASAERLCAWAEPRTADFLPQWGSWLLMNQAQYPNPLVIEGRIGFLKKFFWACRDEWRLAMRESTRFDTARCLQICGSAYNNLIASWSSAWTFCLLGSVIAKIYGYRPTHLLRENTYICIHKDKHTDKIPKYGSQECCIEICLPPKRCARV